MKKALVYLVGFLSIFAVVGSWSPPRGFMYEEANQLTIDPPSGYAEYQQKVEKAKRENNKRLGRPIQSFKLGPIGITDMTFDEEDRLKKNSSSFLSFYNLYIKQDSKLDGFRYTVENSQPYIVKNGVKEKLPFYINITSNYKNNDDNKIIMLSIGKINKVVVTIIRGILIIVGVSILYIFLSGVFKIISSISQAKVFTLDTINTFKNLSYICFAVPLLGLLLNVGIWLYMYIKYPGGFGLDPEVYFFTAKSLVLAAFVYALYRAFKKGYELQQENDLTV